MGGGVRGRALTSAGRLRDAANALRAPRRAVAAGEEAAPAMVTPVSALARATRALSSRESFVDRDSGAFRAPASPRTPSDLDLQSA